MEITGHTDSHEPHYTGCIYVGISSPFHHGIFLGPSVSSTCAPGPASSRGGQKTALYCCTSPVPLKRGENCQGIDSERPSSQIKAPLIGRNAFHSQGNWGQLGTIRRNLNSLNTTVAYLVESLDQLPRKLLIFSYKLHGCLSL